ncbi:MAG: hypothetical protein HY827_04790 [Actinobacteria bacterium]|nr:hypothetical protein [Actinomycetota bacterium]
MFSRAKGIAVLAVFLISAIAFAGCEASVGTKDEGTQLEGIITKQLAGKIADRVDNPEVDDVTCVKASEGKYDCVAKVSYDSEKGRKTEDLAIKGTCDAKNCAWETK